MTLILSIAALLLGPILYAALARIGAARRVLDAAIALAIAFIIVVHVIPEAWEQARIAAIVTLAVGVAFPLLLERLFHQAHDSAHLAIVIIAALGLLVHASIDGMALSPQSSGELAWAVVLHRVPVGMAIWSIVRPNLGSAVAVTMLAVVAAATCAGYFLGNAVFAFAEMKTVALFQAFIAGSLVHVALFGVKHRH